METEKLLDLLKVIFKDFGGKNKQGVDKSLLLNIEFPVVENKVNSISINSWELRNFLGIVDEVKAEVMDMGDKTTIEYRIYPLREHEARALKFYSYHNAVVEYKDTKEYIYKTNDKITEHEIVYYYKIIVVGE